MTRARGSQPAQCTNVSQRAAILRLNLLGRDGKVVAVHHRRGGSSWRQRRHAALNVGSREEPRRYATVLREVAGQDPPAV